MSSADFPAALAAALTTRRFGRVHEHAASLESTNDRALAWLGGSGESPAPDGALVTADRQTAGRGRLGRAWSSAPAGDIYASVVVRPGATRTAAGQSFGALALAVGVGLREGVGAALRGCGRPELAERLSLKWPNDLLLDGRKLAGILCESRWRGRSVDVVVGFGVNVGRERFEGPLADTATSLRLALGVAPPTRAEILAAILTALEDSLDTFFDRGFPALRPRYEPHCVVLGRRVEVETPGRGRVSALALSLDPDGALRVREDDGRELRVESADVWLSPDHAMPAPCGSPSD